MVIALRAGGRQIETDWGYSFTSPALQKLAVKLDVKGSNHTTHFTGMAQR